MHLEFTPRCKARPNHWIVIDDYGTEHDAVHYGAFGGYSDQAAIQRRAFFHSNDQDPDANRAFWCQPKYYSARESAAFTSPIGLSIEADIRIDFELHPAWSEESGEPLWMRADGATIKIITAGTDSWELYPTSTVIMRKALDAFCWSYIDMERAREDASLRAPQEVGQ